MNLSHVTHIVLYRPYRQPMTSPLQYVLFTEAREAMSFESSHRRYCSHMDSCKVDIDLTEELLKQLTATEVSLV